MTQSTTIFQLALFPFSPKNGHVKPGQPHLTGTLQFTLEQLIELYEWAKNIQPDAYGKVKINVSVWDTISQDGTKRYLKGSAKIPQPVTP